MATTDGILYTTNRIIINNREARRSLATKKQIGLFLPDYERGSYGNHHLP